MGNTQDAPRPDRQAAIAEIVTREQERRSLKAAEDRIEKIASLPAEIRKRQEQSLQLLLDNGVDILAEDVADQLVSLYPDIEVRITEPTGDRRDAMGVDLAFNFKREWAWKFHNAVRLELSEDKDGIHIGTLGHYRIISAIEDETAEVEKYRSKPPLRFGFSDLESAAVQIVEVAVNKPGDGAYFHAPRFPLDFTNRNLRERPYQVIYKPSASRTA